MNLDQTGQYNIVIIYWPPIENNFFFQTVVYVQRGLQTACEAAQSDKFSLAHSC